MTIPTSNINRRTFLKAAGVAIALPYMESLAGAIVEAAPERDLVR